MFQFEIYGAPIPQAQTQFNRKSGHCYDPTAKKKSLMQWQMTSYAPTKPLTCPVKVDLTFYFPVPKSTSGAKKRQMLNQVICHIKKPDADNCAYLVTNAMKKIFYEDDSQIVDLSVHKRYGEEPKTVVKIIPIDQMQQIGADKCE